MIDRKLEDAIENKRQRKEKAPFIGRVSGVFEKPDNELETGNIELNVQTRGRSHELRRIPFTAFDHPGHIYVPQVGDHVLCQYTGGHGNNILATDVTFTREQRAPNAYAGHWRHEFNSEDGRIYLEAQPASGDAGTPNTVRIAHKQDGLSEATSTVELDISGGTPTVRIDVGDDEQGLVLDGSDGSVTLLDAGGYGIQSDGAGNFEWYHEDVNYKPAESTTLPTDE